jgi:hypothetical protein
VAPAIGRLMSSHVPPLFDSHRQTLGGVEVDASLIEQHPG